MAHIQRREFTSKRTGKQEVRWQARYRAPDGREHARRFRRKADAEDWLAANTVQLGDGTWTTPVGPVVVVVANVQAPERLWSHTKTRCNCPRATGPLASEAQSAAADCS